MSQLNIAHEISTKVLLICKLWVHIRNRHTGINLDFNLQCIYAIFSWVTAVVELCHKWHKWHRWQRNTLQYDDIPTLLKRLNSITKYSSKVVWITFRSYSFCNVYFYYLCHLSHKWHKFSNDRNLAKNSVNALPIKKM